MCIRRGKRKDRPRSKGRRLVQERVGRYLGKEKKELDQGLGGNLTAQIPWKRKTLKIFVQACENTNFNALKTELKEKYIS